jgi:hypothetical protein
MPLSQGSINTSGAISVPFIQVRPPGYFTHFSITTPGVSALKNYYVDILNHARRLRLEKLLRYETVLEVKRLQIYNGYM